MTPPVTSGRARSSVRFWRELPGLISGTPAPSTTGATQMERYREPLNTAEFRY